MKQSGSADLALMGASIPSWLFERMTKLSLPIGRKNGKSSFPVRTHVYDETISALKSF